MDAVERAAALREYAEQTASCTKCALSAGRTQVVFGSGSPDADLVFVGEAPGFHEDQQGVPFVGQAAASHWHDLSRKVEQAVAADGPAFLNVLSDCPVGWGHEPKLFKTVLDLAVETRLWPLYEVVDGDYRVTYVPKERVPVSEWFALQTRFAHLAKPEASDMVEQIQQRVDLDWERLLRRARADAAAA